MLSPRGGEWEGEKKGFPLPNEGVWERRELPQRIPGRKRIFQCCQSQASQNTSHCDASNIGDSVGTPVCRIQGRGAGPAPLNIRP